MYKFKYHKPISLEESINLFKEKEFPKYLSGGMTLIPSMKQLLSSPTDLIDIQDIKELRGIYESENKIIINEMKLPGFIWRENEKPETIDDLFSEADKEINIVEID